MVTARAADVVKLELWFRLRWWDITGIGRKKLFYFELSLQKEVENADIIPIFNYVSGLTTHNYRLDEYNCIHCGCDLDLFQAGDESKFINPKVRLFVYSTSDSSGSRVKELLPPAEFRERCDHSFCFCFFDRIFDFVL